MYLISKTFTFAASHQLGHLPTDHQCARLHGHNYSVEVVLASAGLDKRSFVVDYGELAPLKQFIEENLDHRHLNDVMHCQTSAENIARWLFDKSREWFPHTVAVRVSETPSTWAEFRGEGFHTMVG